MPEPGGVVLAGSSTIGMWRGRAPQQFPEFNIINRGFGGSQMRDLVYFADRIITPYRPASVVVYSGDNDIMTNQAPADIAGEFAKLVGKVRGELPDVEFYVIAVKPSESRWSRIEKIRETNDLLEVYAARTPGVTFVDIEHAVLGPDGRPRSELFLDDRLHLSPAGYDVLAAQLRPHLQPEAATTQPN